MSETTTALDAAVAQSKQRPTLMTVAVGDAEFGVVRKPGTLILAELARVSETGDVGVIADFFRKTLGDNYRAFAYALEDIDFESDEAEVQHLMGYVAQIIEGTMGRPTN